MTKNKVLLIGRLGGDPELKQGKSESFYSKFSIATNDGSKENPKTNWHNCVIFGKGAEVFCQYIRKGSNVCIEGRLEYNQNEGVTYSQIVVENFTFLDPKKK